MEGIVPALETLKELDFMYSDAKLATQWFLEGVKDEIEEYERVFEMKFDDSLIIEAFQKI